MGTDSYFRFNDQWYQVGNETNTILENLDVLSDVRMVSYEADTREFYTTPSELVYKGAEYEKIRNLGDRHKLTSKRRKNNRNKVTPKRSKNNRNKVTSKRSKNNRNKVTSKRSKNNWNKITSKRSRNKRNKITSKRSR